jgi:CheY-like chemotaxis protein
MAKRVLIVEDEPLTAMEEQSIVTKLGYEVTGISLSGEAAIQAVKRSPPDVILMDIKLSGEMDGSQAAQIIRRDLDIPVIFITAYGDKNQSDPQNLDIPEGFGYIVKPFTESELAGTLKRVLE